MLECMSVRKVRSSFHSEGREIHLTGYSPSSIEPGADVLVLPGAGGMWIDGSQMDHVARCLAEAGFAVHIVNYFNRTGTWLAWSDQIMIRHFATWMRTVHDAVEHIARTSSSNSMIGIHGYSLGGFLAVAEGSRNSRVGAVVEQAGGTWEKFYDPVGPLPPVLVIHGRKDERVYFEVNTKRIRQHVERDGRPFHLLAFDHERHRLTADALNQSLNASVAFFRTHLVPHATADNHSRISR
jgi:dienelactone hydrolase